MNFEFPKQESIKKETLMIERDWEDENLPESFEADVYETILEDVRDEVVIFKQLNQSIGIQKIPGNIRRGDKFKIYIADALDQGVPSDGIVKIKNISTGEVSNTETWKE
jgi:hypothetical protein